VSPPGELARTPTAHHYLVLRARPFALTWSIGHKRPCWVITNRTAFLDQLQALIVFVQKLVGRQHKVPRWNIGLTPVATTIQTGDRSCRAGNSCLQSLPLRIKRRGRHFKHTGSLEKAQWMNRCARGHSSDGDRDTELAQPTQGKSGPDGLVVNKYEPARKPRKIFKILSVANLLVPKLDRFDGQVETGRICELASSALPSAWSILYFELNPRSAIPTIDGAGVPGPYASFWH
jgi:hypothetical protein